MVSPQVTDVINWTSFFLIGPIDDTFWQLPILSTAPFTTPAEINNGDKRNIAFSVLFNVFDFTI